jgi:predicted kinase
MLYIIRGVPGAGKTTLARSLVLLGHGLHLETDMFFTDPDTGVYNFDGGRLKEAHKWCYDAVTGALAWGHYDTVVVSNTFTRHWEYQPYVDYCLDHGVPYTVLVVQGRHQNDKGLPESKVQAMRRRFEYD